MLAGELQLGGGAFGGFPALHHEDDVAAGKDLEVALEPDLVGTETAEMGGIFMRAEGDETAGPDVDAGGFGAADVTFDAPVGGGIVGTGNINEDVEGRGFIFTIS